MRKLESQATKKKKKMKNQIIVGVVMISILIFSTAGFALFNNQDATTQNTPQKITENGLNFQKQDNFWTTIISNQRHVFFYLPSALEDIPINITNDITTYRNKVLYIVNENVSRNQLEFNLLATNYIVRTQSACVNKTTCTEDIPIKNCSTDNIIIYKESNITQVYQKENCIYITGEPIQGTDKFIQEILRIN